MTTPIIRWDLIGRAIEVYRNLGYRYIEVPWIVSAEAVNVTLPPGRKGLHCEDGALVGSAEQSFLQLALDGALHPGRWVAASPCFRDDDQDELHFRSFFKVELIEVSTEPMPEWGEVVERMAGDALYFLRSVYEAREAVIVPTAQGLDIELHGIELGSYGYRNYKGVHWVYGTGIAEPRFTQATKTKLPAPIILDEFDASIAAEHGGTGIPVAPHRRGELGGRTKEPRRPSRR